MIQTIKLGNLGSETELPRASRVNNQGVREQIKSDVRAIDGTLNVAYTGVKRGWNISWDKISETDQKAVETIVDIQYTGLDQQLYIIISNQSGVEETICVHVEELQLGALIQRDVYYNSGYAIGVKEC